MKKLHCLVVAAIMLVAAVATAIPIKDVPNPKTTADMWVEDQAQILGPEYTQLINHVAQEAHDKIGVEMAVVTVDNLDGESVEHYANGLFQQYGVGESGKDNGILILVSRDDRKTRIEVGYGLEAIMNDAKAGRILDQAAIPWFHDNQFGRGLYETTKAVAIDLASGIGGTFAVTDPTTWPAQPEVTFQKAPLRRGAVVMVIMIVTILFSIPTFILIVWYLGRYWVAKTPEKKLCALIPNDALEATLLFVGPIVAGMVGHENGSLWIGFAAVPIPIIMWLVVRKIRQTLSKPLIAAGVKIPKEEEERKRRRRSFFSGGGSGGRSSSFGGGRSGGGGASRSF